MSGYSSSGREQGSTVRECVGFSLWGFISSKLPGELNTLLFAEALALET